MEKRVKQLHKTGQTCPKDGFYLTTCGDRRRKIFRKGEKFSRCPSYELRRKAFTHHRVEWEYEKPLPGQRRVAF